MLGSKIGKWRLFGGLCLFVALYQIGEKIRRRMYKLPPGPSNIVMLYYLVRCWIARRTVFDAMYIGKMLFNDYGEHGIVYHGFPIFFVKLTLLSSSKVAKKLLNHKSALDRPIFGDSKSEMHIANTADGTGLYMCSTTYMYTYTVYRYRTAPFANINGKEWEKRRKLSQSILFRMCSQSKFLDKIVEESMRKVVFKHLDSLCDSGSKELWFPSRLMKYAAFNTIFYANYGRHISIDDPLYEGFVEVITETFQLFESGIILGCLPKLMLLLVALNPWSDYHKIKRLIRKRETLRKQFSHRRSVVNARGGSESESTSEAVCYVDYIERELTESEVEADMGALFGAGTDTTSSSLNFAIVLAAKYGDIQKQVRQELLACYERNIADDLRLDGEVRVFHLRWINELVLFRAFIYEVLRVSSITKGGLPHAASEDIYIEVGSGQKRFCIPKGTIIGYQIEEMHKFTDDEHWVDSSDRMCLDNWLNPETHRFETNESFMTFGSGRR